MKNKKAGEEKQNFVYFADDEKIRWWRSVPPEQKLLWLTDANHFLYENMSPKAKRIMKRLRRK